MEAIAGSSQSSGVHGGGGEGDLGDGGILSSVSDVFSKLVSVHSDNNSYLIVSLQVVITYNMR